MTGIRVYPLLQFFWELVLLRRAPQDLPASQALLLLMVIANILVGTLGAAANLGGVQVAFAASLFDAAIIGALLYGALRLAGRTARFMQTATALFGVGALFGLTMLLAMLLSTALRIEAIAPFVVLGLLAWVHVALGHVLRHALEMELWAGIAVAVGFTVVGIVLVNSYFPALTPDSG